MNKNMQKEVEGSGSSLGFRIRVSQHWQSRVGGSRGYIDLGSGHVHVEA